MEKIKAWIKKNKFLAGVIGVLFIIPIMVIVFIAWSAATFLTSSFNIQREGGDFYSSSPMGSSSGYNKMGDSVSVSERFIGDEMSTDSYYGSDYGDSSSSHVEIREGSMSVKSTDAINDFEKLKEKVEGYEGYIESSSKNEWSTTLYINAYVRVPTSSFDEFVSFVEDNFEVKDFRVTDYRVETQQQLDELAIIRQALEDYDAMRKRLQGTAIDSERIRVLSEITKEMQQLARDQKRIEGDLEGLQKRSDMAAVSVSFEEKISPKIWPEDLVIRFRDHLGWAVDMVFKTGINLFANGIVVFVKVVEYIVYAIIVLFPIRFIWVTVIKKRKTEMK